MSANPIIYCLEHLTDYKQFERLSSDLMSGAGYPNIEPLGGTSDGGRDAIHVSKAEGVLTVFAFTVRSDWSVKLKQDCARIKEEGHRPTNVVFVCTSALSTGEKDSSKQKIKNDFGWELEIYDIERIRVLLAGTLRHLLAQHASIFCPPWFPTKGGLSTSESKDTIVIDHLPQEHSLASWLFGRLTIAGYRTWCYGIAPLVGENKAESINMLLEKRAVQYLPIISQESFKDFDFIGRISAASRDENLVIPCWANDLSEVAAGSKILALEPAKFDDKWSEGLKGLLTALASRGVSPQFEGERGRSIALRAYMPEPVTKAESEKIYSNAFPAVVPKTVMVTDLEKSLDAIELDGLRKNWAFVKISPSRLIAFDRPPESVLSQQSIKVTEYLWGSFPEIEGKNSINVVKELVKRSLTVASVKAGLKFCNDRNVYYFPDDEGASPNVSFVHVDGRSTHVAVTGVKQHGWGERASKFRYQLSPSFKVEVDEDRNCWVTTRIYVRVADMEGIPFKEKQIPGRRKAATKGWWNKEWLARTLGVMQGLANNANRNAIEVGSEERRKLVVSTTPLTWECPISIDVDAVDRIGDFQEEMASLRYMEQEDEAGAPGQEGKE